MSVFTNDFPLFSPVGIGFPMLIAVTTEFIRH